MPAIWLAKALDRGWPVALRTSRLSYCIVAVISPCYLPTHGIAAAPPDGQGNADYGGGAGASWDWIRCSISAKASAQRVLMVGSVRQRAKTFNEVWSC